MSTDVSPKEALKSLQKRLECLHNHRYNLEAHFLYIRFDVGERMGVHHLYSGLVFEALCWRRDPINYFPHYCPLLISLDLETINTVISRGRSRLKDIERWMCWAMRVVRDLRKISELEGDLDRECSELI